jgi:putative DNA primase/helicase
MDERIIKLAALQDRGELPPTSEDALALDFAARYADRLRHVAKWGWWLIYDGMRWRADETVHVFDLARGICREVAIAAEVAAKTVASAKTVAAVERLAKADRRLAATTMQFDARPRDFNTGD